MGSVNKSKPSISMTHFSPLEFNVQNSESLVVPSDDAEEEGILEADVHFSLVSETNGDETQKMGSRSRTGKASERRAFEDFL